MRIIAIANQKGGCGKTTTSINLAATLAESGKNVLLVDFDPQGHSTMGYNIDISEDDLTIYDVLTPKNNSNSIKIDDIIVPVKDKLHLTPANIYLTTLEKELFNEDAKEERLLRYLQPVTRYYDYILIDCPPNVGILTFNALRAANELIIPIDTGFFSLHGLGKLLETVEMMNEKLSHKIRLKALATFYNKRTRLSQEVYEEINQHFSENMFKSVIHLNVKLAEAAGFGKSIVDYDRHSSGYWDYRALAEEIIAEEGSKVLQNVEQNIFSNIYPKPVEGGILFAHRAPGAKRVQIAGDFNSWQPEDILVDTDGHGLWMKVMPLTPGEYQYRFIVDGRWTEDPANPSRMQTNYGYNSIVRIPSESK